MSAWKGASILSSMSAMKGVWVTQKIFKEEGERALTKFSF
jgi:actin-related protein